MKKRVFFPSIHKKSRKVYIILFVILFALIGVYTIVVTRAAGSGIVSLTPANNVVNLGETVTVTVMADSQTVPVNAVQADLTYDTTKLDFVSIDAAGSAYGLAVESNGGAGKVSIVRAITTSSTTGSLTPLTGNQKVATVTFRTKSVGSTAIQVATSSLLLSHAESKNIITDRINSTITTTDKTPPTTPTSLTSPSQTTTSNSLSWGAATDNVRVVGYKIYRNGSMVGTATGTTYTDTSLAPKTSYIYSVAAYDAAGNESAKTTTINVTTKPDTAPPQAPPAPTMSTRSHTSIVINWTPTTDNVKTTGYNIFRDGAKVATVTSGTSYTNSGLVPGKNYSFNVSAFDATGNESTRSPASSFSTVPDTTKPTAPTTLTSPFQAGSTISLSWKASTDDIGIAGYNIYRNGVKIGTSTTTSYSNSGLTPSTAYSFSVSAFDTSGNESTLSNVISATIRLKVGDLNADNNINVLDLSILLANYGKTSATPGMGDLNNDKTINIYDLSMLLANWKK